MAAAQLSEDCGWGHVSFGEQHEHVIQKICRLAGERRATCEVWLDRDDGTRTVAGTAVVGVPA